MKKRHKCPRCGKPFERGEETLPGLAYNLERDSFYSCPVHLRCPLFSDQSNPLNWRWLGWILGHKSAHRWTANVLSLQILFPYYQLRFNGAVLQVRVYRNNRQRLVLDSYGYGYIWSVQQGWQQISKEKTIQIARELINEEKV